MDSDIAQRFWSRKNIYVYVHITNEEQWRVALTGVLTDSVAVIKQLLDEVEHDIMNYQNRGQCYLPKPKAEADNTDLGFDNS